MEDWKPSTDHFLERDGGIIRPAFTAHAIGMPVQYGIFDPGSIRDQEWAIIESNLEHITIIVCLRQANEKL